MFCVTRYTLYVTRPGLVAQLVARLHGMEEAGGSNPPESTPLLLHFTILFRVW